MRELLATTTAAELTEYKALERIDGPLGGRRGDTLAALIASTIANANSGKKSKSYTIADFLPKWSQSKPKSGRDLLAKARGVFGVGGKRSA
ncbi:phage tail assembly protein T [Glycomyces paridis]|uniref:phage tail assembly protein T n=1 Tax=Glycomyces paridis TaxID=2126555 RepID=UPI0013054473|nr:DUF4035 domain-containing protein [Glycomyces paridis]